MNAIDIDNLTVDFGRFKIDHASFSIRKGAITGLIGVNGSGKTTLIKAIMRAQSVQSGKILYDGKRFAGNEKAVLTSVACVFDDVIFSTALRVEKAAKLYKAIYPDFDEKRYAELSEKFAVPQDLKVSKLSFGIRKKLNFILGYCSNADTLILDEPTAGVDPFDRNELTTLLQEYMMDENHSVLLSTHNSDDLDKIADYIVMIDNGRIKIDSDKESLIDKYRLVRTETLPPELEKCAIGVKNGMFGYTFLIEKTNLVESADMQARTPTLEELFVHFVTQRNVNESSSKQIFGI